MLPLAPTSPLPNPNGNPMLSRTAPSWSSASSPSCTAGSHEPHRTSIKQRVTQCVTRRDDEGTPHLRRSAGAGRTGCVPARLDRVGLRGSVRGSKFHLRYFYSPFLVCSTHTHIGQR